MISKFSLKILTAFLLSVLVFSSNSQAQSEPEIISTDQAVPTPVELFSINFDLSPETAIDVGQVRFGCYYNEYNRCKIDDTIVFEMSTEMGKIDRIDFRCPAYNGCSFSRSEIISALESQKSLDFNKDTACAVTELGAKICISEKKTISMIRGKFRVPELNFD